MAKNSKKSSAKHRKKNAKPLKKIKLPEYEREKYIKAKKSKNLNPVSDHLKTMFIVVGGFGTFGLFIIGLLRYIGMCF